MAASPLPAASSLFQTVGITCKWSTTRQTSRSAHATAAAGAHNRRVLHRRRSAQRCRQHGARGVVHKRRRRTFGQLPWIFTYKCYSFFLLLATSTRTRPTRWISGRRLAASRPGGHAARLSNSACCPWRLEAGAAAAALAGTCCTCVHCNPHPFFEGGSSSSRSTLPERRFTTCRLWTDLWTTSPSSPWCVLLVEHGLPREHGCAGLLPGAVLWCARAASRDPSRGRLGVRDWMPPHHGPVCVPRRTGSTPTRATTRASTAGRRPQTARQAAAQARERGCRRLSQLHARCCRMSRVSDWD